MVVNMYDDLKPFCFLFFLLCMCTYVNRVTLLKLAELPDVILYDEHITYIEHIFGLFETWFVL
jgi:hypothetical protein